MTNPASAIKDEVRLLIDVQIETFGQPAPITSSQLREYQHRSEDAVPRTGSDWHKERYRTGVAEGVLAPGETLRCPADAVLSREHADQPRGQRRRGMLSTRRASSARAVLAALIWFVHSVIESFLDIRCMFAGFRNQVWEGNLPARSANQVLWSK